jgi:hypothetical protein
MVKTMLSVRPSRAQLLAAALAMSLAACGGGGDDDTSSPDTYSAAQAYRDISLGDRRWEISGVDSWGNHTTLVITRQRGASGAFPFDGSMGTRSMTRTENSAGGAPWEETLWYDQANGRLLGTQAGTSCNVATDHGSLPTRAKVGDGGALHMLTTYYECTAATNSHATWPETWSIERIDDIVFFCIREVMVDPRVTMTTTTCYEMLAGGAIGERMRLQSTDEGPGFPEPYENVLKNY